MAHARGCFFRFSRFSFWGNLCIIKQYAEHPAHQGVSIDCEGPFCQDDATNEKCSTARTICSMWDRLDATYLFPGINSSSPAKPEGSS